jgi:hypothetical protein
MAFPVIRGPVPPYSNNPIAPQFYQPSQFFISGITLGQTTVITTSVNHNFVLDQEVRLLIPPSFGTIQLNHRTGFVIAISAPNQVTLNINSTNADAYIASTNKIQQAQIIAIGDVSNGVINTGRSGNMTYVPGAFINISP